MIYAAAIALLLMSMCLLLIRAMIGPTTYDRILALNIFGTVTVLTIALLAGRNGNPMLIDVALLYGLINFTATIALLRYFKLGSFDDRD